MTQTGTATQEPRRRDPADTDYDVVVVGGQCAGASLAIRLARGGWRFALIDRDDFPSDTVSTHLMFPDALQELDELGVLERLEAAHRLFRSVSAGGCWARRSPAPSHPSGRSTAAFPSAG